MEKIVVASTNRVKIEAALNGFQKMFPDRPFTAEGVNVESGVSAQPATDEETLQGALNRAQNACSQVNIADYWVGIEGGVEEKNGEMEVFAWIVVIGGDRISKSRTANFYLPQEIIRLIHQGVELGDADDQVFGRSNSKQKNGSVGILTLDVITRLSYYEHAVILALIPFKNPNLNFNPLG